MRIESQPQQFDKSERIVWDEFLQKYVVDYMPEIKLSNRTPKEIAFEQEQAERRAEHF